jgi:hypothetical protein
MEYTVRFLRDGFLASTGERASLAAPDLDPRIFREGQTTAGGVTLVKWRVSAVIDTVPAGAVLLLCQVGSNVTRPYRVATGLVAAELGEAVVRLSIPDVSAQEDRKVRFAWVNEAKQIGSFSTWVVRTQQPSTDPDPEELTITGNPSLVLDETNALVVGAIVDIDPGTVAGGTPPYEVNTSIQSADDAIGTGVADDAHIPGDALDAALVGKHLRAKVVVTDDATDTATAYGDWTTEAVVEPDPVSALTITSHRFVSLGSDEYQTVFAIPTGTINPASYTGKAGTIRVQLARVPGNPNGIPNWGEYLSPYNYAEGQRAVVSGSSGDWRCNDDDVTTSGNWIKPALRMPVHRPPDTYAYLIRYSANAGVDCLPAVRVDPNITAPIFSWITATPPPSAFWRPMDINAGAAAQNLGHYGDGHQFCRCIAASGNRAYAFGDMCWIRRSDNFGSNWKMVEGNGLSAFAFNSGAVDPDDEDRVIAIAHPAWFKNTQPYQATSAIWLSTDGGGSWTSRFPLSTGDSGHQLNDHHQHTVCFDPNGGNTPATRRWYHMHNREGFGSQLMVSSNGGSTWANTGAAYAASKWTRVHDFQMHPTTANRFYIGTSSGFFTSNGVPAAASDWVRSGTGLPVADCRAFAVNGSTIYVALTTDVTADRGVWKSTNTGSTWTRVLNVNARELRVDWTSSPHVVVVRRTIASGDSQLTDLYVSVDGGATFSTNKARVGPPGDANQTLTGSSRYSGMIAHPTVGGVFVINESSGRVWKSVDKGQTWSGTATKGWQGINTSLQNVMLHKHPSTGGRFTFGCEDLGFMSFTNYGKGGFTRSNIVGNLPSPQLPSGQKYWEGSRASSWSGCVLRSGREICAIGETSQLLFRKQPGATNWTPGAFTGAGITSPQAIGPTIQSEYDTMNARYRTCMAPTDCIREHPTVDNVVWAGPFKSTDGGANWVKKNYFMLDMHPDGTGYFMAAGSDTDVYRSTNWQTSTETMTPFYQSSVSLRPPGGNWHIGRADPYDNTRLYTLRAGRDLARVTNTGSTFNSASAASFPLIGQLSGLTAQQFRVGSLAPSFNTEGLIYCAVPWAGVSNLWRGVISGSEVTWTDITGNAPKWALHSIDVHPETDDVIIGGGCGLWCYPPPTVEAASIWQNLPYPVEYVAPAGGVGSLIIGSTFEVA